MTVPTTDAADKAGALEARLRRLEDLAAIHQLFVDYGELLDAGDFAAYAELFAEDGEVLLGPLGRATGRAEIRALLERAVGDGVGSTYHIVSSPRVELDGDHATATVMWTVVARDEGDQARVTMLGHHVDELVRVGEQWRFRRRTGVMDVPSAYRPPPPTIGGARLARLVDQQEIRDVVYRYCRGIDRRDFELVRSCYHPGATDDHGDFRGPVEDFVEYARSSLSTFESTMHVIGNVLVEPVGDRARAESYAVAYHRVPPGGEHPARDFVVGLRYVDDFQRRDGEWRIAARVCAFEWSRLDPVPPGGWIAGPQATRGRIDGTDVVFTDRLPPLPPPT